MRRHLTIGLFSGTIPFYILMVKQLLAMSLFSVSAFNPFAAPQAQPQNKAETHVLAKHEFSLEDRYAVPSVNDVFKDNILLTLHYMNDTIDSKKVSWNTVEKPFSYTFKLAPKQTFAFHDDVLPQYKETLVKTTKADFSSDQGFKSDGYLVGDGVCHLASLIDWTAKDAGLTVYAPTNHNFAVIPDVPREYGVAIYDQHNQPGASAEQNLYITNNQDKPINFTFAYDGKKVNVQISEAS